MRFTIRHLKRTLKWITRTLLRPQLPRHPWNSHENQKNVYHIIWNCSFFPVVPFIYMIHPLNSLTHIHNTRTQNCFPVCLILNYFKWNIFLIINDSTKAFPISFYYYYIVLCCASSFPRYAILCRLCIWYRVASSSSCDKLSKRCLYASIIHFIFFIIYINRKESHLLKGEL